ncbi:MAG TPA: hypothetical protein VGN47_11850 [Blastococcus sp.]|nr:hypothetical protein [Blastococcus sp.]
MANGGTGMLTASTLGEATPDSARRAWPQWLLLGLAMIAVAVVAVAWHTAGARLLLGALGLLLAVRGAVLVRGARSGALAEELTGRARGLGAAAAGGGAVAVVVAILSAALAARVLLVAVPVALIAGAVALLTRGGAARRSGQALLVWAVLVTGLLAVTGLAQGWGRATDVVTVVAALAVAVLGVPLLIGAAQLRTVAAQPAPAPAAGCGGCACGAGGCGALG